MGAGGGRREKEEEEDGRRVHSDDSYVAPVRGPWPRYAAPWTRRGPTRGAPPEPGRVGEWGREDGAERVGGTRRKGAEAEE